MFSSNQWVLLLLCTCFLTDNFCRCGEISNHSPLLAWCRAHKLFLDPATGIFRIKIGQARIPLVPLLKTMGVTDKQLRESWGDLAAVNQQKSDPQALKKLYERVRSTGTDTDPEAQAKSVAEAFQQMELDPDVTKRTLGQAFTHVGPDSILATTKKLLAVSRGEQEPDDRDSMAYQSLMGPEDLFAERITKAKNIARNLLWKSTARRGIDHIPAGVLTSALQNTLTMSGLGQALEEINTAEILDHQSRVTRRGEGGIQDASAIPMSSRSVNPSQLGLIDYLRTPESLSAGIDVRLARNAMKGSDGRLYTKVINAKSGLTETRSANDIADATMAFSGELQSGKPYVNVLQNGKIRTVPRESVDFELPDTESSFSPLGNMIPFKSMVKGSRSVMGSRFLTQALPLENAEAPYVQSGIPGQVDRSFEQEYGTHMGALRSAQGGVVTKVAPDSIDVKYDDGTKETHELYNNHPLNRKTLINQTPTVRPGQTFKQGDLLARSNYTDHEGTTALGMNARVAYMPDEGYNYEDAISISESFARRMCFDCETQILTANGWKSRPDLQIGECVAVNRAGRLSYEPILSIYDYESDEFIEATGRMLDVRVTPEHSLFVATSKSETFYRKTARGIRAKQRIKLCCRVDNDADDQEFFALPSVVKLGTAHLPGPKNVRPDRETGERLIPMDDWCVLFGLYLAEGWCDDPARSKSPTVYINRCKPRVTAMLSELTPRLGFGALASCDRWLWASKQAAAYLRPLGKAPFKYLPEWVWELSQRQARLLLYGMVLGDGYPCGSYGSYSTSSRQLADGVQRLALHCGWAANFYLFSRAGSRVWYAAKERWITARYDSYRIAILTGKCTPHLNTSEDTTLKRVVCQIPEAVWCVTTNAGVVYVRRNGKPRWCGNSSETFANSDSSEDIKQGTKQRHGDPMILIASERERNKKSLVRSRTSFSDKSITWDHHSPGIVTDVVQTAKGPAVVVKSQATIDLKAVGVQHSGATGTRAENDSAQENRYIN